MEGSSFNPINDDFFDGTNEDIDYLTYLITPKTFTLSIKPQAYFLDALTCLAGVDSDTRKLASFRILKEVKGLEVMVRNTGTGASAYLKVPMESLSNFSCEIPEFYQTISLGQIFQCFVRSGASKNDPITIYQFEGHQDINVKFGGSVAYVITVIEVPSVAFQRYPYPDFGQLGSSTFQSAGFRNAVLMSITLESNQVEVDITDDLKISIRNTNFAYGENKVTKLKMEDLKGLHTTFPLPHHESLTNASRFTTHGTVSIPWDKPTPDSIIFEFTSVNLLIAFIIQPLQVHQSILNALPQP